MDIITLDFETYYDKDYSLRKMTTEAYIRDPRFEVIGVSIQVNNEEPEWASGSHKAIKKYLDRFDWANSTALAHNNMFDGAILSWIFDIHPKVLACTLCIARAVHGVEVGASLAALAKRYEIGEKGTEVVDAMGKRRKDFAPDELSAYGDYCINDVELCLQLFQIMASGVIGQSSFPKHELDLIDLTLRMFTEPTLDLDVTLLEEHLENVKDNKEALLAKVNCTKKELMSGIKFAELLTDLGVYPPIKTSPTTGKEVFAFAKTDKEFMALQEHEDDRVQALVAARLGTKSTLEETRTERFIGIAKRGLLPVPVRYYAAHTGRWGGDDKINLQNLPNRGQNGKVLKRSIIPPAGHVIIDGDSSQIEARVLAWIAGEEGLVEAFANGDDVYKTMAGKIYQKAHTKVTKLQRFVGKSTILGSGYGMGAVRFQDQLRSLGTKITLSEARRIIRVYRSTYRFIPEFWDTCGVALHYLHNGNATAIGRDGLIEVVPKEEGLLLPSGLILRYSGLAVEKTPEGQEFFYLTRRGNTKIYGGKVVENLCQALARIIVGEQMILIAKEYKPVLTVHDSIAVCTREHDSHNAVEYVAECLRHVPEWAKGLPLGCEVGVGESYGACE